MFINNRCVIQCESPTFLKIIGISIISIYKEVIIDNENYDLSMDKENILELIINLLRDHEPQCDNIYLYKMLIEEFQSDCICETSIKKTIIAYHNNESLMKTIQFCKMLILTHFDRYKEVAQIFKEQTSLVEDGNNKNNNYIFTNLSMKKFLHYRNSLDLDTINFIICRTSDRLFEVNLINKKYKFLEDYNDLLVDDYELINPHKVLVKDKEDAIKICSNYEDNIEVNKSYKKYYIGIFTCVLCASIGGIIYQSKF